MAYTAIDNSQSVIQHYGKKGMKWKKRRGIENYDVNELDVATGKELEDDENDSYDIDYWNKRKAANKASDKATLERIYGKGKVTDKHLAKYQDGIYGKQIKALADKRQERFRKLRDRKNKVNKMSTLNIGNGSPRI